MRTKEIENRSGLTSVISFAIALLFILTSTHSSSAKEAEDSVKEIPKKPNILMVVTDDQSWLHTSISGDKVVKTPSFDRIAKEGIMFTNSYAASPSCTASRTAILSGQDIYRTKQAGLLHGAMPSDLGLYPHMLEDIGYHVGSTGKGWAPGNWIHLGGTRRPTGTEYNGHSESINTADGLAKSNYSKNFKEFLGNRPKDRPFAFWFGAREPHRFYQRGAGQNEGFLDPKAVKVPAFLPDVHEVRQDILDYYYEIEWFDTHLGSVLEELEKAGELENTLIIVTSDNGMPFPRAKVTLYDWGTRMPLAIRWGNGIANKGRVVDDFVMHTDFAPTILEAVGLPVTEEMTGKSLLPIFKSNKEGRIDPSRNKAITALERHTWARPDGVGYPSRAIRTDKFLYIKNHESSRWPTGGEFHSSNKSFHGDIDPGWSRDFLLANKKRYKKLYKLVFGKRSEEELYEVASDPGQIKNLAYEPKYQDIKLKLAAEMQEYLVKTKDPRVLGKNPWADYVYHQYDRFGMTYNRLLSESERRRARLLPGYYLKYQDRYTTP